MKTRLRRARLLIAGLATMGLLGVAQPDAKADCIYARAWVRWENQDRKWIYGEDGGCILPTPFEGGVTTTLHHTEHEPPPYVPQEIWIQTHPVWP
jgi:hypothetical protein